MSHKTNFYTGDRVRLKDHGFVTPSGEIETVDNWTSPGFDQFVSLVSLEGVEVASTFRPEVSDASGMQMLDFTDPEIGMLPGYLFELAAEQD